MVKEKLQNPNAILAAPPHIRTFFTFSRYSSVSDGRSSSGQKALLAPAAWEMIHFLLHIRCAEAAVNLSVLPVSILTASLM